MSDDLRMDISSESALNVELQAFHDGFLDGFLILESSVLLFLSTMEKQPYVLIARGVEQMKADDFRQGNIILDVLTRRGNEISINDVKFLYGTQAGEVGDRQARKILERITQEDRIALEVNPSYGCECLLIAQAVTMHTRSETAFSFE
jgi:hypothetical protein